MEMFKGLENINEKWLDESLETRKLCHTIPNRWRQVGGDLDGWFFQCINCTGIADAPREKCIDE